MYLATLESVSEKYRHIPYMGFKKANFIREKINENDYSDLLELGFFHGKSSLLLASILEERKKGHLTTIDLHSAKERKPNIETLLNAEGLTHRVTPLYCTRSYNWELIQQIQSDPTPRYDFCYLDGGHTLDHTGLGFFLVDKLLRVGGTIVFDDLDWTLSNNPVYREKLAEGVDIYAEYSESEKNTPAVKMVFENLVGSSGYQCETVEEFGWGIAQKVR